MYAYEYALISLNIRVTFMHFLYVGVCVRVSANACVLSIGRLHKRVILNRIEGFGRVFLIME